MTRQLHNSAMKLILALVCLGWLPCANAQWYDSYKDLSEIYAQVDQFSIDYPSLVSTSVTGLSYEGRDIRAFKIAGTGGDRAVKPAVLLNSLMHAREWITPMANMYAAEQLLTGYGTDPQVTRLLDQFDVHVIPVGNPDGYEFSWASPANRLWRKNRRLNDDGTYGVDLNRNFDFSFGTTGSSGFTGSNTYRGTAPFSEPETQAIRDFYEAHPNIVGNIDLHSYSQLVLGPYGHSATAIAADAAVLDKLGKEMEVAISLENFNSYTYQRASDLYLASGIQSDWSYGTQNVYAYTYELRPNYPIPGFELPAEEIIPAVTEAYAGIEVMLEFTYELTTGDFNYDGVRDCDDLNLMTMEFASSLGPIGFENKFEFDLSGDGWLSADDVPAWLLENGFGVADANLDGVIDDLDRQIWAANEGATTHSFCQGDFNSDGTVDALDFNIWQATVPEPSGVALLCIGLLGLLRHCRLSLRRK